LDAISGIGHWRNLSVPQLLRLRIPLPLSESVLPVPVGPADNRSGGPLVAGDSVVVLCNRPAFHGKNTAETKRGWLTFGQTGSRNSSNFVSEESEHGQKINQ